MTALPHIGVSLPEDVHTKLKSISEKEKRSISQTARILIEDRLKEIGGK